jgi:hypothetical protein
MTCKSKKFTFLIACGGLAVSLLSGCIFDSGFSAAKSTATTSTSLSSQQVAGIYITSGNQQSGIESTQLALPLKVTVLDTAGKPASGTPVIWKTLSGGGTLSWTSSVTDASGNTSALFTLGAALGTQSILATVDGTSISSQFTVNSLAPGSVVPPPPAPSPLPGVSPTPTPVPTAPPSGGNGTVYYVSPSGNDGSTGTSQASAWKSVGKINASVFKAGDSVLFQGGQIFSGCLTFTTANVVNSAESNPFTVSSYGGTSFTLMANCSGAQAAAINIAGVNGFTLNNAILVGNGGGAWYGVWIHNPGSTVASGITIQNSDIGGFYTNDTSQYGAEIFLNGFTGGLSNVNILNNTLHGLSGAGSRDDNGVTGWSSNKSIRNVVYSGNTLYNIGGKANGLAGCEGNGINANGVDGGVIQNNVAHDLGGNVNTCGGAAGFWAASANNITIQYNEAYGIQPISYSTGCDWDGFDLDLQVTNSVMQYNYSHDNYGAGFLLYGSGSWGPNTIRYNISQNDGGLRSTASGSLAIGGDSGTAMPLSIYNNTVYNGFSSSGNPQNPILAMGSGVVPSGVVGNNIFYSTAHFYNSAPMVNTNGFSATGLNYVGNNYFTPTAGGNLSFQLPTFYPNIGAWQAAGYDPQAKTADPLLVGAGAGGICGGYSAACLKIYKLQGGSPMLKGGVDLTRPPYSLNVGSKDFFGNSISAPYSVGAYGGL